jgi:hypothetical protein
MLRTYHPLQPSHTGKYLVSVIESIFDVESGERATVYENTLLIFSDSPKSALEEALRLKSVKRNEYKGVDGRTYLERFCGVSRISPIHEEIESGAEISWLDLTGIDEDRLQQRIAGTTVEEIYSVFDKITEESSDFPPGAFQ